MGIFVFSPIPNCKPWNIRRTSDIILFNLTLVPGHFSYPGILGNKRSPTGSNDFVLPKLSTNQGISVSFVFVKLNVTLYFESHKSVQIVSMSAWEGRYRLHSKVILAIPKTPWSKFNFILAYPTCYTRLSDQQDMFYQRSSRT